MLGHISSCIDDFVFTWIVQRKGWFHYMKSKWKRLLGLPQYDVLGLDIGSSSVRMVQLARDKTGFTVVTAAGSDIEQSGEPAAREENIVKAVQESLDSAKPR